MIATWFGWLPGEIVNHESYEEWSKYLGKIVIVSAIYVKQTNRLKKNDNEKRKKETENMFSVFLSSYRNTRGSLEELERVVETFAFGSCSDSILVVSNFHTFYSIRKQR